MISYKEPKAKALKRERRDEQQNFSLPIPIRIQDSVNKEHLKCYKAVLIDKRVYIEDEQQAQCLYKFGCFGKGEFSRGEPILNSVVNKHLSSKENNESDEYEDTPLSLKNISKISAERFDKRTEWKVKKNFNEFHEKFLNEFTEAKVRQIEINSLKCRIDISDGIELNYSEKNRKQAAQLVNPFTFVIKNYPNLIVQENLCLMPEEAFYLCYALGCLKIYKESGEEIKLIDLWRLFSEIDSNFVYKYVVYHKIRSKGWILKNGIKYGSDFLAYYKGPEFYHASYSIIVRLNVCEEMFASFCGLARVNETASKELLICYVQGVSENTDLSSPKCLSHLSVLEILVNRWVPQQNRADSKTSCIDASLFYSTDKQVFNDSLIASQNDQFP